VPEPSGLSLQVGAGRLARTAEERRVVTVLFADLTGSTALAERLDVEDMRLVLERLFEALAREVTKLDGTVDKYVGDEIMAVFGAPVAHEDDAARAVTAAAAMQAAMPALNASLDARHDARLALRIGINTGEVVAGVLGGQIQATYTVVGDPVNTAKRLQAAAHPGQILVGEPTRQAAARSFEFESAGAIAAKGKAEPVRTYEYVRTLADAAAGQRALVGRVRERDTLIAAVQRAKGGTGGVVAILGEAGIGKTRLLAEARAAGRASGIRWLQGQASSNGQTMSYLPFREMLRSFGGISDADDDGTKWSKLRRQLVAVLRDGADDVLPYVGAALSLRLPAEAAERVAGLDGDAMRRQVLRSAYLLFEGLAHGEPTAVVLEDCHWMDRSSEQLLSHLLPLSDRLLFICTGRPENDTPVERIRQVFTELASDRYTEIALTPLAPHEGIALLHEILGTRSLPPGLADAVVRRAEGNPFFAEEIVRAFRDMRILTRDASAGDWMLADQQDPGALPTTVNGVIAARVDRLSQEAREVALVASVIGRTFSERLLTAVDTESRDVRGALDELHQRALIRPIRGAEDDHAFAHALIQEAIYAGLLVRRRRELHARVAAAMERLLGEHADENYGVLAYHYAQAEDWSKAQEYLFKVGDQALRIAADAEAIDHYERALEAYARAFGDKWDPFERAAVERKIGESRYRLGEFDRARRHLDRALQLLGYARPRSRAGVRLAIGRELIRQVGHRTVPALTLRSPAPERVSEAVLQTLWFHQFIDYSSELELLLYDVLRTLNIAERAAPSHRTLRAYFGMTLMCHNIGLKGMGSRYARMASAMSQQVTGSLADALGRASVGLDHYARGRWNDAATELAAAASAYLAVGELEPWAAIRAYLNIVLVGQGRLLEALPIGSDLEHAGRAARDRRIEALGPHCRAHLLSWAGSEREAVLEYGRAMAMYRAIPDHHLWLSAAGALAMTHIRSGELEAARALVDEGLRLATEHRLLGWWLTPVLTARAELLLRDAEAQPAKRDRLLADAERVVKRLKGQGRLHDEALPAAFRELGSLLWLRGRHEAARAAWRRSVEAAERLGAVTELFQAHAAIARYSESTSDREAAATIATRLHAAIPARA
jgi:class 3 adenylate cyclase/tetratricopeptide (TPR) repeat protein